ncbi:hypothetical protein [Pelagibacterium luteolum]|uniref:Uncharacterized protein n=1 Tax=Pelagibacterium luteolum TaxID=440168 RepID=A0A1G7XIL2_9HYPH|nr:hypothetical protein [Pelagibacterium luteolum]SDG83963.1 hypothetical protein SAMN04487974_109137 [Pelagibacterium luteolum]
MPAPAKISKSDLQARFANGARLVDVSKALGFSALTVARHCKLHGIEYPTKRGPAPRLPHVSLVIAMVRSGIKTTDIARKYNVTPSAIPRLLERNHFALAAGHVVHDYRHGRGTLEKRASKVSNIEN